MSTKVGINGFGRIGRLALRRIFNTSSDLEVVAINDLTSPEMLAHLLKYDTAHGQFDAEVSSTDHSIIINGKEIPVYAEADAKNIPWVKNDGVELVLEATGFYTSKEKASSHLEAGAKRVLVSAPAGQDVKTVVYGVNDEIITPEDEIVSAASCTTNCLAPMAKAVNDAFGIKSGTMTTIHAYTATQKLQDGPDRKNNVRNARAGAQNIIPHSTGAAKAIGLVVPSLKGKLDGHAQRVPVITGSLTELVAILDKEVTAEEVNAAVKKVAENNPSFGYNADGIVSSDIIGTTFGSVFDPTQTQVIGSGDGQIVKVVSWYDNEAGFTAQMIRTLEKFASML